MQVMGTLYQAPDEGAGAGAGAAAIQLQDLKVAIKESTLVYPSQQPAENKSLFLSNIDQVLDFHVQTLHFFPPNPQFPPQIAIPRLRTALQRIMVAYDFLGGRLKPNQETGRLEIQCKPSGAGAGAGFVVAATDYSLDELGDLIYPNPAFVQLILLGLEKFDDHPLCVLQVLIIYVYHHLRATSIYIII